MRWLDPYRVMSFDPDPDVLLDLRKFGSHREGGVLVQQFWTRVTVSFGRRMVAVIGIGDHYIGPMQLEYSYAAEDREEAFLVAARCVSALRAGATVEFPAHPSRVAVKGLAAFGVRTEDSWLLPQAVMPHARCRYGRQHLVPYSGCACGYHAAYSVEDLVGGAYCRCGVLIVVPQGRTLWHENAWRSESYATVAAAVPLNWERPEGRDPRVPVERAQYPLFKAREIQLLLQAEEAVSCAASG